MRAKGLSFLHVFVPHRPPTFEVKGLNYAPWILWLKSCLYGNCRPGVFEQSGTETSKKRRFAFTAFKVSKIWVSPISKLISEAIENHMLEIAAFHKIRSL